MKFTLPITLEVDVNLTSIREDVHWSIFRQFASDLGFMKNVKPSSPFVEYFDDPLSTLISDVARSKDIRKLDKLIKQCDVQSILSRFGTKRDEFDFFRINQIASFLKKFPFQGNKKETKKKAIEKFIAAEHSCSLYNSENYRAFEALSEKHPDFLGVIEEVRQDIEDLIGDAPSFTSVCHGAKHGPGVSLGDLYKGGKTTSFYKWSNLPYSCTTAARPHAIEAISNDARWYGALDDWYRRKMKIPFTAPINVSDFWDNVLETKEDSKITSVPKNYQTDRTIAIEPLLNVYLQLGVDSIIRTRLKRWGVDLNSQQKNQKLAKEGSETDKLATVDLSAASDMVSLKICELLLPPGWMNLLLDLRCRSGILDGEVIQFSKISSMGNGFTFALESLIFAALARCAIRRTRSSDTCAVYGDDIIVATTAYPYLKTLLELSGFKVNVDKTFTHGPFRESCGVDTFMGHNVRPVYLKQQLNTIPALIYLHNRLFASEAGLNWGYGLSYRNTRQRILNIIPSSIRETCVGPPGESFDTYLFSEGFYPDWRSRKTFALVPHAQVFKRRRRDWFFIKLMNQLHGKSEPVHYGKKRTKLAATGNSFDIVKRDIVSYKLTQIRTW